MEFSFLVFRLYKTCELIECTYIHSFQLKKRMRIRIISCLLILAMGVFAQNENLDMSMMAKIRDEGMNHSQVMEIAFNLTDASGPRLMQSPGYFKAANWAKTKLASWGLINSNLEVWGNWGKGW